MKSNKKRLTTIAIHIFIWVAFALLPLLIKPKEITFNVSQLQGIYLNSGITVILFYLSYIVIIPLFFYKKRIFLTLALLVLVSVIGSFILSTTRNTLADKRMFKQNKELRMNSNMPRKYYKKMRQRSPIFDNFFFFLLVAGAALSIRATQKWMDEEHDRKTLEVEKVNIELAWLKNQVSPHFFFNTLNNIYALALDKSDKTPKIILKLSELMRYLLYETQPKRQFLEKEILCIQNYLDLERIRFGELLEVNMDITGDIENKKIAPIILLSFVENSFKHGANKNIGKINIDISFEILDDFLFFTISNPTPAVTKYKQKIERSGGIGIKNVKKRLELGYSKDEYELTIKNSDKLFYVMLKIKLK